MNEIIEFIKKTPKAELHIHIEGTLEPELMLKLAERKPIQETDPADFFNPEGDVFINPNHRPD